MCLAAISTLAALHVNKGWFLHLILHFVYGHEQTVIPSTSAMDVVCFVPHTVDATAGLAGVAVLHMLPTVFASNCELDFNKGHTNGGPAVTAWPTGPAKFAP